MIEGRGGEDWRRITIEKRGCGMVWRGGREEGGRKRESGRRWVDGGLAALGKLGE